MRRDSWRSANGDSRVLPIRLRCSDLSGGDLTRESYQTKRSIIRDVELNKGGTIIPAPPEPTFHATAKLAKQAPPEAVACRVIS